VVPSLNVTVPVGVPEPGAVTLTAAVNVTDCPKSVGFALEVTTVVVVFKLTTCVKLFVLPASLVSPP